MNRHRNKRANKIKAVMPILEKAERTKKPRDLEHAHDVLMDLRHHYENDPEITATLSYINYLQDNMIAATVLLDLAQEQRKALQMENDGVLDDLQEKIAARMKDQMRRDNSYAPCLRLNI
ncbi:MAG: hypothetical protein H6868_08755 [Rhodospirillales bacterium]|nr:hypothetical protein [Rhodospirillales bacterium]